MAKVVYICPGDKTTSINWHKIIRGVLLISGLTLHITTSINWHKLMSRDDQAGEAGTVEQKLSGGK
jgi:hypothetical protein